MRVPLWLKLMFTFLAVVGTTLLPVFVFMRRRVIAELREGIHAELTTEATRVREQLDEVANDELVRAGRTLGAVLPHRITLVDPRGRVLFDSQVSGALESHSERPEIVAALRGHVGLATRRSATTGQESLYVALGLRDRAGVIRAVVRLSKPQGAIESASAESEQSINRALAIALSIAVVLSAAAAVAMSRPLRRLASLARAYAEGDFGHAVEDAGSDEVGDAARSLGEMAVVVRNRLLATGADRATLGSVLDELPLGIVLYDARNEPAQVNGAARTSLGLTADAESDRLAQLARISPNAEAVARVLDGQGPQQVRTTLPWSPGVVRSMRWFSVFLPDGSRRPAAVVLDGALASQAGALVAALRASIETLRDESRDGPGAASPQRRTRLLRLAESAESALPSGSVEPDDIEPLGLADLCDEVSTLVAPRAQSAGVQLVWELPTEPLSVADAHGRTVRAVARWLGVALDALAQPSARGGPSLGSAGSLDTAANTLVIDGEVEGGALRLSVRAPGAEDPATLLSMVGPLGGDAGHAREGALYHSWIKLARA